ncbi:MAG: hypothetical protein VW338_01935 [Rhodospirillaceae bacterium]
MVELGCFGGYNLQNAHDRLPAAARADVRFTGIEPAAADAAAHRANLDRDLYARLAGDEPDVVELVGKLAGRDLSGLDMDDAKAADVVAGSQTHRVAGDPVAVYGTVIGKANGHCGLLRSC